MNSCTHDFAYPVMSGTVIRGTPNTPKHGWKTSSKQTVKTGKHSSKLKPNLPRDATSSRPSPASGKNSSPGRIHASPEDLPRQWAHPRLARGQAQANFVVQQWEHLEGGGWIGDPVKLENLSHKNLLSVSTSG
jgi:hypothetical protein